MADIPIEFLPDTPLELQTEIRDFVVRHHTLERLLVANVPIVAMVSQDEFTSDLVVRYAEDVYLVYDTT